MAVLLPKRGVIPAFLLSGGYQSIGGLCSFIKAALARLKGLLPKKPLWADKGEGWADSMTT
jgi:hypothetical protein